MLLTPPDAALFFRLHPTLMFFVNQRLKVLPDEVASPEEFIARGWDECLGALDRLDAALAHPDWGTDPCLATGDGWVAEEALATSLLCFVLYPNDPVAAVRRAALTRGDSDSIACLAGAFAGAYSGLGAWPPS